MQEREDRRKGGRALAKARPRAQSRSLRTPWPVLCPTPPSAHLIPPSLRGAARSQPPFRPFRGLWAVCCPPRCRRVVSPSSCRVAPRRVALCRAPLALCHALSVFHGPSHAPPCRLRAPWGRLASRPAALCLSAASLALNTPPRRLRAARRALGPHSALFAAHGLCRAPPCRRRVVSRPVAHLAAAAPSVRHAAPSLTALRGLCAPPRRFRVAPPPVSSLAYVPHRGPFAPHRCRLAPHRRRRSRARPDVPPLRRARSCLSGAAVSTRHAPSHHHAPSFVLTPQHPPSRVLMRPRSPLRHRKRPLLAAMCTRAARGFRAAVTRLPPCALAPPLRTPAPTLEPLFPAIAPPSCAPPRLAPSSTCPHRAPVTRLTPRARRPGHRLSRSPSAFTRPRRPRVSPHVTSTTVPHPRAAVSCPRFPTALSRAPIDHVLPSCPAPLDRHTTLSRPAALSRAPRSPHTALSNSRRALSRPATPPHRPSAPCGVVSVVKDHVPPRSRHPLAPLGAASPRSCTPWRHVAALSRPAAPSRAAPFSYPRAPRVPSRRLAPQQRHPVAVVRLRDDVTRRRALPPPTLGHRHAAFATAPTLRRPHPPFATTPPTLAMTHHSLPHRDAIAQLRDDTTRPRAAAPRRRHPPWATVTPPLRCRHAPSRPTVAPPSRPVIPLSCQVVPPSPPALAPSPSRVAHIVPPCHLRAPLCRLHAASRSLEPSHSHRALIVPHWVVLRPTSPSHAPPHVSLPHTPLPPFRTRARPPFGAPGAISAISWPRTALARLCAATTSPDGAFSHHRASATPCAFTTHPMPPSHTPLAPSRAPVAPPRASFPPSRVPAAPSRLSGTFAHCRAPSLYRQGASLTAVCCAASPSRRCRSWCRRTPSCVTCRHRDVIAHLRRRYALSRPCHTPSRTPAAPSCGPWPRAALAYHPAPPRSPSRAPRAVLPNPLRRRRTFSRAAAPSCRCYASSSSSPRRALTPHGAVSVLQHGTPSRRPRNPVAPRHIASSYFYTVL
ncbi:hypothetical protein DENSPDRAFT_886623 [Dentipellis sp. KUC8613]|nr:hypothetical protein DENSPDRAFT_886623 [Dentipellis sp. KUC8613]